jgi:hypothetical protein
MRHNPSNADFHAPGLRRHEVLCRSTNLENLIHLADGITAVQICDLGSPPSPAMQLVAESLRTLGDPDLPFSIIHRELLDSCDEALGHDLHILAGRAPNSSTLFLAFAPVSLRGCIAEIGASVS